MKIKTLLPILLNVEYVRICMGDSNVIWSGYAHSIPKKYYNENIDKVCSFPYGYSNSFIYIFVK